MAQNNRRTKIQPLDVSNELPDQSSQDLGQADGRSQGQPDARRPAEKLPERESSDSGLVDVRKDEILEQHYREHPEGDPAVRRIRPDRGEIPVEDVHGSTMTVFEKKKKTG